MRLEEHEEEKMEISDREEVKKDEENDSSLFLPSTSISSSRNGSAVGFNRQIKNIRQRVPTPFRKEATEVRGLNQVPQDENSDLESPMPFIRRSSNKEAVNLRGIHELNQYRGITGNRNQSAQRSSSGGMDDEPLLIEPTRNYNNDLHDTSQNKDSSFSDVESPSFIRPLLNPQTQARTSNNIQLNRGTPTFSRTEIPFGLNQQRVTEIESPRNNGSLRQPQQTPFNGRSPPTIERVPSLPTNQRPTIIERPTPNQADRSNNFRGNSLAEDSVPQRNIAQERSLPPPEERSNRNASQNTNGIPGPRSASTIVIRIGVGPRPSNNNSSNNSNASYSTNNTNSNNPNANSSGQETLDQQQRMIRLQEAQRGLRILALQSFSNIEQTGLLGGVLMDSNFMETSLGSMIQTFLYLARLADHTERLLNMAMMREGLTDEDFDRLDEKTYYPPRKNNTESNNPSTDETCAICLEDYKKFDCLKNLGCGHMFHKDCLKGWAKQKTQCPLCKREIAVPGR